MGGRRGGVVECGERVTLDSNQERVLYEALLRVLERDFVGKRLPYRLHFLVLVRTPGLSKFGVFATTFHASASRGAGSSSSGLDVGNSILTANASRALSRPVKSRQTAITNEQTADEDGCTAHCSRQANGAPANQDVTCSSSRFQGCFPEWRA